MLYRLLADLIVIIHLGFIFFVAAGGFLVLRWPNLAWFHLPAAAWGALIEFQGWVCPLTPLENHLKRQGGSAGYEGGFIENYIVPLIYPDGLTRDIQIGLGISVLVLNCAVYAFLIVRYRRSR